MDKSILQSELLKAEKRYAEQSKTVESTQAIIDSDIALPSLKKIAKLRLPKLLDTCALTAKVISELHTAIHGLPVSPQTDIEASAPPTPLKRGR